MYIGIELNELAAHPEEIRKLDGAKVILLCSGNDTMSVATHVALSESKANIRYLSLPKTGDEAFDAGLRAGVLMQECKLEGCALVTGSEAALNLGTAAMDGGKEAAFCGSVADALKTLQKNTKPKAPRKPKKKDEKAGTGEAAAAEMADNTDKAGKSDNTNNADNASKTGNTIDSAVVNAGSDNSSTDLATEPGETEGDADDIPQIKDTNYKDGQLNVFDTMFVPEDTASSVIEGMNPPENIEDIPENDNKDLNDAGKLNLEVEVMPEMKKKANKEVGLEVEVMPEMKRGDKRVTKSVSNLPEEYQPLNGKKDPVNSGNAGGSGSDSLKDMLIRYGKPVSDEWKSAARAVRNSSDRAEMKAAIMREFSDDPKKGIFINNAIAGDFLKLKAAADSRDIV